MYFSNRLRSGEWSKPQYKKHLRCTITKEIFQGLYKKGIEFALLAPTAMNQQKFSFELTKENKVKAEAKKGFYTKVDLGIAKYNFELGAEKENFEWAN